MVENVISCRSIQTSALKGRNRSCIKFKSGCLWTSRLTGLYTAYAIGNLAHHCLNNDINMICLDRNYQNLFVWDEKKTTEAVLHQITRTTVNNILHVASCFSLTLLDPEQLSWCGAVLRAPDLLLSQEIVISTLHQYIINRVKRAELMLKIVLRNYVIRF